MMVSRLDCSEESRRGSARENVDCLLEKANGFCSWQRLGYRWQGMCCEPDSEV
jgi:hypothetical protein